MTQSFSITTNYMFEMPEVQSATTSPTNGVGHDGSFEEIVFVSHAARRGYTVFMPFGHSQKADVAIWKAPHRPITIQVKRGWQRGGDLAWKCYVAAARGGKDRRANAAAGRVIDKYKRYRAGDFDVLAMFHPPTEGFYFWKLIDVCGQRQVAVPALGQFNNWHVIEDALAS
jgi:hypothetical protein